jgi:hypothetical protein
MYKADRSWARSLIGCAAILAVPTMAASQTKPALVHSVDVLLPPPLVVSAPQYVTAGGTATYTAHIVGSSKTNTVTCEIVNNGTIVGPSNAHSIQFTAGPTTEPLVLSCMQSDGYNISPPGFTTIFAVNPVTSPIISAPASVSAGSPGGIARVDACANCTYYWSVNNANITSDGGPAGVTAYGKNTITFTAGVPPGGTVQLAVTVTGPDGSTAVATLTIGLVP